MRDANMKEIIRRAITRTSTILFKPFDLKKWLILIFIAMFAGAMSFGNSNSSSSSERTKASRPASQAGLSQVSQGVTPVEPAAAGEPAQTAAQAPTPGQAMPQFSKLLQSKIFLSIASAIIILIIMFSLLMMWVSSRFRFVWFNAIAANDASIIEPFHRHKAQGNSLFKASLAISVIFFASLIAIIGWGILNANNAGAFKEGFAWSAPVVFQLFTAPIMALLIVLIIAVILGVAIDNFVVMVMALDKAGFIQGIKKAAHIYKTNLGDIILLHFVLLGLVIVCAIMAAILAFIVTIILILLGLLIFGGGYAILVAAAKLKLAFIIYSIVLGIPFLTILFIALLCVQLPFAVFMRSFSIEYLLSLGCGYTYEGIAKYAQEKSPNRSKTAVILPIALILMLITVFMIGLLAAIAIPNFIKAREAAINKRAGILSENYSQNRKV